MAEITRETVRTQGSTPTPATNTSVSDKVTANQTIEYIVYFFFGVLEVLLVFRLVLKVLGASMASGFVNFIYGLTGIFVFPFAGIFHQGVAQGIDGTAVLEPATIVAIIVYAVLAGGIVKLIQILSREPQAA